ncbi:MAG: cation:dicarboxylase symporter family transporter, partial [Verrucomicrobiales bacterium]|nr:cation:dicarboxylase symporter family transporter [Verrucomicrobiales bacterium]
MKLKPWQQILIAMLLALIVGSIVNAKMVDDSGEMTGLGSRLVTIFDYVGNIFMSLLKMIIVPLVLSSVVVGIARLGSTHGFARMGGKTILYYMLTSFFAILIGLSMVNIFQPGLKDGQPNAAIREQISAKEADYAGAVAKKVGDGGADMTAVSDIFLRMIPENIVETFGSNGKMLSLIFVSILTGIGLIFISDKGRGSLLGFFEGLNELSLLVTNWIMLLAPIGVFALVAETVSQAGLPIVLILSKYFFVVIVALLIHLFIVMPMILIVLGKVSPRKQFYAMRNALLTAFSTSSSSATLPVTMRAVQENAGVSNRVSSFVLPL